MKTKTQFTRLIMSVMLCLVMLLSIVPFTGVTVSAAEVPNGYTGYNIENGDVTITRSGKYYIYGTNKEVENTIYVNNATGVEIILEDVNIKGEKSTMASAMHLYKSEVTLKLKGTNTLRGDTNGPGIEVSQGSTLTVTSHLGDGYTDGVLNAYGGDNGLGGGGAGIGARGYYVEVNTCGTIIIKGGTINAVGDGGGAGIGGAASSTTGTILISGGNVTATSDANGVGAMGAGIGGGFGGYVERIEISGGNVTANGSRGADRVYGAAIGCGDNTRQEGIPCGEIVISGGTIVANGNVGYGGVLLSDVTNSGGSVTISNGVDLTVNKNGEISPAVNGYFKCNVNIAVYDDSIVSDQDVTLSFVQEGVTVLQKTVSMTASNHTGNINTSFMMDQTHLNKSTDVSVMVGSKTYTATLTLTESLLYTFANGYFKCNVNIAVYDDSIVSDQNVTLSFVQEGVTVLQKTVSMTASNYIGNINTSFILDQTHLNKSTDISVTVGSKTYTATLTLTETLTYIFGSHTLSEVLNVSYGNVVFSESGGAPMLTYYDETGAERIVKDIDLNASYKITGTTEQYHIEVVKGNVKLILEDCDIKSTAEAIVLPSDGAEIQLTLKGSNKLTGGSGYAGIPVHKGIKLTIDGDGSLEVTGGYQSAGIGTKREEELGDITINGGTITAIGGSYGAGIGTGYHGGSGGSITINGGNVTAKGGLDDYDESGGAGIGGGNYGHIGSISITGGIVKATGEGGSAGIGGGHGRSFEKISISGGTVTAVGGTYGAGIGSGSRGNGENRTITISGGTITATGGANANGSYGGAGIGSGYYDNYDMDIIITGGNVKASSDGKAAAVGNGYYSGGSITVTNGAANGSKPLSLVTITLAGESGEVTVDSIDVPAYYGMDDVVTMDGDGGELYLYLPDGERPTEITLENGDVYKGKVNSSSVTFVKMDTEVDEDGFYLIADIGDLIWFSQYAVIDNTISGRVTADIDASGSGVASIGVADAPYAGTFDGGGHRITVDINSTEDYAALFDYVNGATIRNLTVDGSITTSKKYASGLIGNSVGTTTIDNVISRVVIESSVNGDGTHGGFVGVASGTLVMKNCGFEGEINGAYTDACGGFIGWVNGGTVLMIENSYLSASFGVLPDNGHTIARNYANATVSIKNFYYLNELNETPVSDEIIQKSAEQFANGEVEALLNGSASGTATMFGENGGTGMLFTGVLVGIVLGILGTLLAQRARRKKAE